MITLTPALDELRLRETITWARLFKIAKRDNTVVRLTDWSTKIEFDESGTLYTYDPTYGPSIESMRQEEGAQPTTTSVMGFVLDAPGIDPEEIREGRYDRARVDVWVVDGTYPWAGSLMHQVYWLHDIIYSGEKWRAQLRSVAGQLDVQIGRVYNKRCDATLYDSRCTVSPTAFQVTGQVTAVSGWSAAHPRLRFRTDVAGKPDKWARDGFITWTTGANVIAGLTDYDVKNSWSANGEIELWSPTPHDISVGDQFVLKAGCNKLAISHCKNKFSNIENHRGFRFMPTMAKVIRTPNVES